MKIEQQICVLMICAGIFSACHAGKKESGDCSVDTLGLERVNYNLPALEVDLGVGLWAWPLPMDFDSDGDMDLLVSCNDVPFNGLYFFENPSGPGEPMPVFEPPVRIGPGKKNLQVSYVDGDARILERGREYLDFSTKLYNSPAEMYPPMILEEEQQKIRFSLWKLVDYDDDGDMDIIAGIDDWADYGWDNAFDSSGTWTNGPLHGYVYWLENEGGEYRNRGKILARGEPLDVYGLPSTNMDDFDRDGDLDLLVNSINVSLFENTGLRDGMAIFRDRGPLSGLKLAGHTTSPTVVDWNNNGIPDLLVGGEDGHFYYAGR